MPAHVRRYAGLRSSNRKSRGDPRIVVAIAVVLAIMAGAFPLHDGLPRELTPAIDRGTAFMSLIAPAITASLAFLRAQLVLDFFRILADGHPDAIAGGGDDAQHLQLAMQRAPLH